MPCAWGGWARVMLAGIAFVGC
ncbi:hypothetical protein RSK60_1210005 [Ralstonia solanacearum K60]|nr:hypothetical protein RSK60_1210005 [Ralstonia solanacearum K60]